jgi:hypothetical protein
LKKVSTKKIFKPESCSNLEKCSHLKKSEKPNPQKRKAEKKKLENRNLSKSEQKTDKKA